MSLLMVDTGIDERTKHIIVGVISTLFPQAKIYLFGSRARGDYKHGSDIDIAIDTGKREDYVAVGEARDMLNESSIPWKIEVVDFHNIPEKMQQNILRESVTWKD